MYSKSIKNMTLMEKQVVVGGNTINDNTLVPSESKFSFPETIEHTGIRGGLKIISCKINDTIEFANSTITGK